MTELVIVILCSILVLFLGWLLDDIVKLRRSAREGREERKQLLAEMATETFADVYRTFGAADASTIRLAEKRSGVRFPEPYRWLLSHCGVGEFRSFRLFGIDASGDFCWFDGQSIEPASDLPPGYLYIGDYRSHNRRYLALNRKTGVLVTFDTTNETNLVSVLLDPDFLQTELTRSAKFIKDLVPVPWDESNVRGWDRHWQSVAKNKMMGSWKVLQSAERVLSFASTFLATRQYQTVFIPANGISVLPVALMHLGYSVTAQDISPFACRIVETYRGRDELLAPVFPVYDYTPDPDFGGELVGKHNSEKSVQRVVQEYRDGGTLTITSGDIFDYQPEDRFDVIIDALFAQTITREQRDELANLYAAWLNPGGAVVILAQNVGHRPGEREAFNQSFLGAGFIVDDNKGDTFFAQLDAGAKGVYSIHGSG